MRTAIRAQLDNDTPRARFAQLHAILRDRICLLHYAPGTAIHEAELTREFGISRTPIRRVLQMLEVEGLVETTPGVGSIVTAVDLKSLRDAFALRVKLAELLGDMGPIGEVDAIVKALNGLELGCRSLLQKPDVGALCLVSHQLQSALLGLSGNTEYRLVSEALYFKTIRAYYTILGDLDWTLECSAQAEEISEIIISLRAQDLRAVGLVRRNHIVRTLSRIMNFLMAGSIQSEGVASC